MTANPDKAQPFKLASLCEKMIKIIIADDQDLIRQGISALLAYQDDLEIVAQAALGKDSIGKRKAESKECNSGNRAC